MMTGALVDREREYDESALEMAGLDPADVDDGDWQTPRSPDDAAAAADSPGEWRSPSVCGSHVRALLPLMKEFDAREVRCGWARAGLGWAHASEAPGIVT